MPGPTHPGDPDEGARSGTPIPQGPPPEWPPWHASHGAPGMSGQPSQSGDGAPPSGPPGAAPRQSAEDDGSDSENWQDRVGDSAKRAAVVGGMGVRIGARFTARFTRRAGRAADSKITDMVGGPARKRIIVLFAAVLALSSADTAAIGAAADLIKSDLGIGNTQIGLLVAVVALAGGVGTLPMGMLADRFNRVRLLTLAVVLWAAAMVASGAAPSYEWLIYSRIALGFVVAAAGPVIASLVGDLFFPHERGRVLGFVLAGELLGTGLGFVVAGMITAVLPWRAVFFVFAIPAVVLAHFVWRVREPQRGGQDRLEPVEAPGPRHRVKKEVDDRSVGERVQDAGITPTKASLTAEDPARMPIHRAVAYVLKIPSNVALIVSSALGYFFFAGLKSFGFLFIGGHFGLGNAVVAVVFVVIGAGAVLGVLFGGRVGDWLVRRGRFSGRMLVGASGYMAVPLMLPVVLVTQNLLIALPVLVAVAAALAWPNPALDSARLDVVANRMWGRAESVRTVLKTGAEALAPILFGLLSERIAGGGEPGLRWTFAIMLLPLLASGVVLFRSRKHYAGDVAAAALTEERFAGPQQRHADMPATDASGRFT
ncbi:MAG: MFS transporter [Streptosporangiales bacterium]